MIRKLVSLAISLLILAAIYYKIDIHRLGQVFVRTDPLWLVISLAMVIPLTICTAWRLEIIAPAGANIHFGEAMRLNLVASTFNMILPSKMGDIVKAFFMRSETMRGSLTLSLVIFEKERRHAVASVLVRARAFLLSEQGCDLLDAHPGGCCRINRRNSSAGFTIPG